MKITTFKQYLQPRLRLISLLAFCLIMTPLAAHEVIEDFFVQQKLTSQLIINLLQQKLQEQEITVLNSKINAAELTPHEVHYIHDLKDDTLSVRVHFALANPLAVPNYDNFEVNEIHISTDKGGEIKSITAQVVAKKTPSDEKP